MIAWKIKGVEYKYDRHICVGGLWVQQDGCEIEFIIARKDITRTTDILIISIDEEFEPPGFKKGNLKRDAKSKYKQGWLLHLPGNGVKLIKLEYEKRLGQAVPKPRKLTLETHRIKPLTIDFDDADDFAHVFMVLQSSTIRTKAVIKTDQKEQLLDIYKMGGPMVRLPGKQPAPVSLIVNGKQEYMVTKTIAYGGYGKVRYALDVGTNKLHAVKVFRSYTHGSRAEKATESADLKKEINIQKQFSKIKIHDEFEISSKMQKGDREYKKTFIVMDLFACSLKKIIGMLPTYRQLLEGKQKQWTGANLNTTQIYALKYYIFREVLSDISKLHKGDMLHSDIKDDNALVSYEGLVALADYGRVVKATGECIGTAGWYGYYGAMDGYGADLGALGLLFFRIFFGLTISDEIRSFFRKQSKDKVYSSIHSTKGDQWQLQKNLEKLKQENSHLENALKKKQEKKLQKRKADVELARNVHGRDLDRKKKEQEQWRDVAEIWDASSLARIPGLPVKVSQADAEVIRFILKYMSRSDETTNKTTIELERLVAKVFKGISPERVKKNLARLVKSEVGGKELYTSQLRSAYAELRRLM
jgi:serine/threonine protein kinase